MKDPLIKRIRFLRLRFTHEAFEKIEKVMTELTSTDISEFICRFIFTRPLQSNNATRH